MKKNKIKKDEDNKVNYILLVTILMVLFIFPIISNIRSDNKNNANVNCESYRKVYHGGDTNKDGKISVTDYVDIRQNILGLKNLSSDVQKIADINQNNKVDVGDYIYVRKYILGYKAAIDKSNSISIYDYQNDAYKACISNNVPTVAPTVKPTIVPTVKPTVQPTATPKPTATPTPVPTATPTPKPTADPNAYTINYYGNGETSGSMQSHVCTMNGSCTIKANGFTKTGYTFVGWTTNSNGTDDNNKWTGWSGTWKYTNGTWGIANNTLNLYAMWSSGYVLPDDSKFNAYTQVASCSSSTLKYRIIEYSGSDYVLIWANNPYMQLNSALATDGSRTSSAEKILEKEISTYGYSDKCMVATNASFFNMSNGSINGNVILNKGNVIRNTGNVTAVGVTKNNSLREYVNSSISPLQADGIRNSFVHSNRIWASNNNSSDTTNRTIICQHNTNNFVIVSGSGSQEKLAYNVQQLVGDSLCFNLDGGGSRKLYYKTKSSSSMTKRFGGGRTIPDMLYFVE